MSRLRLRIPLPTAWLLSNLVVLALVAGFLWLDMEQLNWYVPEEHSPYAAPTPEPDRVVGIELRCELVKWGLPSESSQLRGKVCELATDGKFETTTSPVLLWQVWNELTVRTPAGSVYTVNVSASARTPHYGDRWPQ